MGECPTPDLPVAHIANLSFNMSFGVNASTYVSAMPLTESLSDPSVSRVERLKFIAYGIVSSVIILLGILGNMTNLVVLTRPNLKGVTFVYLTWLAISDLSTLLVSFSSMLRLHGMQPRTYAAAVYYAHMEMPLVNALMASSVFLVVALTIDRYFSVCLPTRFKEVHNERRAKRSITAAYGFALILYIPVCFQKRPVQITLQQSSKVGFIACDNVTVVSHPIFKIYLMVKEIIVRIGPVIILAVLNTAIIVTFRRTLKKRRNLLSMPSISNSSQPQAQSKESSKKYREERRLIILLGGIVVLFFISMTPAAVLTILNSDDKEMDFGFQVFRAAANILELSNYAMNFYVYCMCSSEIRRTFISLVTCSKESPQGSSGCSRPSVESNTRSQLQA